MANHLNIAPMSEFPNFEYSNKQVLRAGEALAGDLVWNDDTAEGIRQVFRIANNWRDSHALPMRRMRQDLIGLIRRHRVPGLTAARLKRMQSIRKKLRRLSVNLNQVQDLAGCRAILPQISDVDAVVSALRNASRHTLHNESDYVRKPKPDGYRSHHLVFKFNGVREEEAFNGRRIEIQIRTRLQHSWATAVEAVGLFFREDMKGGQGNSDWLRLFYLMSAEFALAEGCDLHTSESDRKARVQEVVALDKRLKAAKTLENLSTAVKFTDEYILDTRNKPEYYLIKYNNADSTVTVEPYRGALNGTSSYDNAEASDNATGKSTTNAVLVEVDKLENLKEAYPNYFGDVQLFKTNLISITRGDTAQEYTLPPQHRTAPRPRERPDLTWFTKRKRWK
jgi:hypothetical protein